MDKSKIYGIEFDEASPFGGEKRICDSVGMKNDYVIGNHFQGNGINDFDSAYPFGAMRLCNVRRKNGETLVTYEGEDGFTRSGENGNVMVQIPKFYAKREKIGSVERWMISGTKHEGFSTEPAFFRDGKELDYVYVGAYNSATRGNGVFSFSGETPDFCRPQTYYREEYEKAGYDVYDLAVNIMLQRLIAIEFCNRRVKYQLGGLNFVEYYYRLSKTSVIHSVGKNWFTKAKLGRNFLYYPGMQMMFCCPKPHHPDPILRTLTRVEEDPEDPDLIRYSYEGEDLSPILIPGESHAGGFVQKNGLSDGISYHTGRTDHVPPMTLASPPTSLAAFVFKGTNALPPHVSDEELIGLINPFRYRGIENVWGNIWEFCEGLAVKDLRYYYTFDPAKYGDAEPNGWKTASFSATQQNFLGEWTPTPAIWTKTMGLDKNEPLLPLPAETAHGVPGNFYDAGFYCYHDKDYSDSPVDPTKLYAVAVGGGYDHYWFGSLFTYRCFLTPNVTKSWLYSSRLCLRK